MNLQNSRPPSSTPVKEEPHARSLSPSLPVTLLCGPSKGHMYMTELMSDKLCPFFQSFQIAIAEDVLLRAIIRTTRASLVTRLVLKGKMSVGGSPQTQANVPSHLQPIITINRLRPA